MPDYTLSVTVARPHRQVEQEVRDALSAQGFGVLTEIDIAATLKAKLGVEGPANVILGACNPPLAHRALQADAKIATLLPCNVTVRALDDDHTVVEAIDPGVMSSLSDSPDVVDVAAEARTRLSAALHELQQAG